MTSDTPPPADRPFEEPAYVPPAPTPYTYPPPQRQRPFGVTLLAILEVLAGIFFLLAAIGSFLLSAVIDVQEWIDQLGPNFPQGLIEAIPFFFGIMGIVFLILAILWFLIAYGYLKGRGWSWTLSVVLLVLSILFNVIGSVSTGFSASGLIGLFVGIAVPIIVLVYLFQSNVKAWFGKT